MSNTGRTSMVIWPAEPWPEFEETMHPSLHNAAIAVQNQTYLMKMRRLPRDRSLSTVRTYNGATVNGNFACGVWVSYDGGVTATRLTGTASTAQSGANAHQETSLAATVVVPAGLPWFLSWSSDSATGTHLSRSGWSVGTFSVGDRSQNSAGYNITTDRTLASMAESAVLWWVQVF